MVNFASVLFNLEHGRCTLVTLLNNELELITWHRILHATETGPVRHLLK